MALTVEEVDKLMKIMQSGTMETLMNGKHVGIGNACLRLRMLTDGEAEFHMESEPEVGTFTMIRVPVKNL